MKKQLFSLVMMLALVIVAGSAMGQNNRTPYPGSTYSYRLDGVKVIEAGPAEITMANSTAAWTLSDVADQTGALTFVSGTSYTVKTTSTEINFKIKFDLAETPGVKTLKVAITDGSTGGCTNFIELKVEVQALPALSLTSIIASKTDLCQVLSTTPLTDNEAASLPQANLENSFTFTVASDVTNIANYTYSFSIALTDDDDLANYAITYAGPTGASFNGSTVTGATADGDHVFTVKFKTTTGFAPKNIVATLNSATLVADTSVGGGTYVGTIPTTPDNAKTVIVKTMPSIGNFD